MVSQARLLFDVGATRTVRSLVREDWLSLRLRHLCARPRGKHATALHFTFIALGQPYYETSFSLPVRGLRFETRCFQLEGPRMNLSPPAALYARKLDENIGHLRLSAPGALVAVCVPPRLPPHGPRADSWLPLSRPFFLYRRHCLFPSHQT